MPKDNKYTCAKCGSEKNGTVDKSTTIGLYQGFGKEKKTGNEYLCTMCLSSLMDGWKYPINLK